MKCKCYGCSNESQQADRITELEFQIRMNEMKYLERIEELEKLVEELYQYKESYENGIRFEQGYGHN